MNSQVGPIHLAETALRLGMNGENAGQKGDGRRGGGAQENSKFEKAGLKPVEGKEEPCKSMFFEPGHINQRVRC